MVFRANAVATICLLSLSALSFADSGTFEHVHCYSGTTQTLKHSDGNVINAVTIRGTIRASTPGQVFDNMSSQCVGLYGQIEGAIFAEGFCEFFDNDTDRIFFRYQRKGTEGTFQAISGTGKYQGLSFDATYTAIRFPQTPGFLQGCAHNKGRWERK